MYDRITAVCVRRLSRLTDELDGCAVLAFDLDVRECRNADQINADGCKVAPCDRYGLDCLIRSTGSDCLNFYGLTEKLAVGGVTNMYTIVEKMTGADLIVKP